MAQEHDWQYDLCTVIIKKDPKVPALHFGGISTSSRDCKEPCYYSEIACACYGSI